MIKNKKNSGLHLWAVLKQQHSGGVRPFAAIMVNVICLLLLVGSFTTDHAVAADDAAQLSNVASSLPVLEGASPPMDAKQAGAAHCPKRANFEREPASQEARQIADWVVDSKDNRGMPFVIVDKTNAKVFVFYADGRLRGASFALLGLALGDDAVPGIGNRKLSSIRPVERTTPAGRFEAALGRNLGGMEILWVDYDGAISMHQVITTNRKERRLERLSSSTLHDKRISYGCINVPAKFYKNVVSPAFTKTNGIVYVLPETRSARELFKSYDVDGQANCRP